MKIVFDDEVEQHRFLTFMTFTDTCPSHIGLQDQRCSTATCYECWKQAIKAEVKTDDES